MPALVLACGYGAGLLTGLLPFLAPGGVAVALVCLLGGIHRPRVILAGGALLLGLAAGRLTQLVADRDCARRLPAGTVRLRLRLIGPIGAEGGPVAARTDGGWCRGTLDLRWPERQAAPAGTRAEVTGRWLPRPGVGRPAGVLAVERSRVDSSGGSTAIERLRNWLTARVSLLYGARAPLVGALVLGQRGTLDPAVRERFARSGLAHLLAISGLHVGLLAGWAVMLARLCRARRSRSLWAGCATALGYAAFLGWPAPATRAAVLLLIVTAARLRQRRVRPGASLGLAVICLLLADPWTLLAPGAWLSVSAVAGVIWAGRRCDRWGLTGPLARLIASSVGATLATAPITAAVFGSVSLAGLVLNMVAIPLAGLAVPALVLSLVAAPIPLLADALAAGAGLCLAALDALARLGASVSWAHVSLAAEPRSALPWLGLLGLVWWGTRGALTIQEGLRRGVAAAAGLAWVALIVVSLPQRRPDDASKLSLHFLDVGQGDGIAIRTPAGRWIVVDAGPTGAGFDAGRRVVAPFLAQAGAEAIALLVVSHAHADHLGGAAALLDRFPVGLVLEPAAPVSDQLYDAFLSRLVDRPTPWRPARAGDTVAIDGVRLTVLHPDTAWSGWGADLNEDSVVLRLEYGDFQALLGGDAGLPAETWLAGRVGPVDLIKVGHHGSRGATGEALLAETHPAAAVISVGRKNRYGHPAPEALARLAQRGVPLWRTDRDGAVAVTTDGRTMTIRGARGAAMTFDVRP